MAFTKIIGMDIGHGETSVVCMEVDTKKIHRLVLGPNQEKVVPSVVGVTDKGDVIIGRQAGEGNNVKEVIAYFKKSPKYFDEIVMGRRRGDCISMFVKALVKQIFLYNKDVLTEAEKDNIQLVVGCPSTTDWTDEPNRKKYERLLRTASGFANTTVVPESRAALFSTFTSQGMQGITAADGVLVFDFGSSTADCTFMSMGKMRMEYSWTLGASAIEEAMFEEMQEELAKKAAEKGVRASFPNIRGIEFALRLDFKEKYYTNTLPEDDATFVRRANVVDKNGKPVLDGEGKPQRLKVDLDVDWELMNKVTMEKQFFISPGAGQQNVKNSWYGHCESFLLKAKEELQRRKLSYKAVMLTGGASKMGFVQKLCQDTFGGKSAKILISQDPSFSVSLGLAWTGMVDSLIEAGKQEALQALKGEPKCSNAMLVQSVANLYTPIVTKQFDDALNEWASSEVDGSVSDLQNKFQVKCGVPSTKDAMEAAFKKGVEAWLEDCAQSVQKAAGAEVNKIYGQDMSFSLLHGKYQDRLHAQPMGPIMLPEIDIAGSLQKAMGNIGGIIATVIGVVSGGFGLLLGPLIGWILHLLGKKNDPNVPCNAQTRQNVRGNASSLRQDITAQVQKALTESIGNSGETILSDMLDEIIDVLALRRFDQEMFL